METPFREKIQPVPTDPVPRTLVASMAMQCLSPTGADLPEEIVKRARSIESEQRQLIAQRESSKPHESRPQNLTDTPTNSQERARDPITPPSSTPTQARSTGSSPMSLNANSGERTQPNRRTRSFDGRRSLRPRALDINALRRERQFSGPYSANPLLPRKRGSSEDEAESAGSDPKFRRGAAKVLDCNPLEPNPLESESRDSNRGVRLPLISQMTTAPFVASGGSRAPDKLWPPLCTPSPRSGVTVSLPGSASQISLLTPPSATIPKPHLGHSSLTAKDYAKPENQKPELGALPTLAARMSPSEKKERYMQLCSEMWDLIKG